MIRFTILVAALYGICCAMAWGEGVPPPGDAASRPGPAMVDGGARLGNKNGTQERLPVNGPTPHAGPIAVDHGGSLLRATLAAQANPSLDVVPYNAASAMAVAEQQPRVMKKHDMVTIIVREESQASATGTTDLKKSADFDAKIDSYVKMNLSKLQLQSVTPTNALELKAEGSRNFKGESQVDRTDTFTARIGAEVIDVKPNGTLILQAKKHIKTDEEEQEFILTGTCRAEDIQPDNTVVSNQLNDLDVHKVTKGAARDGTKRGLIPRLLDAFSPF
jgi:flagellar L-ring protein precursor FlgH